jgi:hypothetical protein
MPAVCPPRASGAAGVGTRESGETSNVSPPHGGVAVGAGYVIRPDVLDGTTRTWSTPSLVVLTATAVVLLGAALWHLAMVFLTLSPASSVTNKYQQQINGYIYPEFEQNWKMFAPNPIAQNIAIGARVQTAGYDGARHTSEWVNLSAPHLEAIRHNPLPSHLDQNVLCRAWEYYVSSHNQKEENINGRRGALSAEYLARIALQHFGREWNGERIVGVQLASRTNSVAPPKWTGQPASDNTDYRVLPWWPVNEKLYKGAVT